MLRFNSQQQLFQKNVSDGYEVLLQRDLMTTTLKYYFHDWSLLHCLAMQTIKKCIENASICFYVPTVKLMCFIWPKKNGIAVKNVA